MATRAIAEMYAACFHSIGFPCERGTASQADENGNIYQVSIQLVSPARGEPLRESELHMWGVCFHSIGFPCERGTQASQCADSAAQKGFHSIGFPCERGTISDGFSPVAGIVSIQLVSPARGEHPLRRASSSPRVFPFNWFPLREGNLVASVCGSISNEKFPFNWFPLREGNSGNRRVIEAVKTAKFPFNWFPLREGNFARARDKFSEGVVSIQLVSPARGELDAQARLLAITRFHSIGFPCERGT